MPIEKFTIRNIIKTSQQFRKLTVSIVKFEASTVV